MRTTKTTVSFKWFQEVWNEGNRNSIDELLTKDVIAHGLGPAGQIQGVEGFKQFYDDFRNQLKNVHVLVEDVICQDDLEASLCKVTGVDAISGKKVEFSGICMVKIENGKIAQAWNHYDFLKMYQQLGFALTPQ